MKVTQEKLPASRVGLEIEVTAEQSKQAYDRTLERLARELRIPGFRKGKVPRQVLVQRVGTTALKANALEALINDGIQAAVKQESIPAIGNYDLRSEFEVLLEKFTPGEALAFSAAVDVQPEAALKALAGVQVEAEEVTFDAVRVDTVLADYQKQMATLVPVEGRAAQLGDVAVIDFAGVVDATGEEIQGGKGTDFQTDLETERFIPGFVDGIVGMSVGETKDVKAQFPEDYSNEDVAGQAATFTITLKELKARELPALDDEFAKEASGGQTETIAELRETLEKRFREEAESKTKANRKEAILTALAEQLDVDLPETLIQQEVSAIINETAARLSNQGVDVKKIFTRELIDSFRETSRDEAIARLRRTVALGELAKQEGIDIENDAVEARVRELLADFPNPQQIDRGRLTEIVAEELLEEKLIELLGDRFTITLVPEGSKADAADEAEAAAEEPTKKKASRKKKTDETEA